MLYAISLQLRLDRYKLLPWHSYVTLALPPPCLWTRVTLRPRLPKLLHSRTPYYRHAPCPKHGAQMTTMMNTPCAPSIHDESQRTDWQHADLLLEQIGKRTSRRFIAVRQSSEKARANVWCRFLSNRMQSIVGKKLILKIAIFREYWTANFFRNRRKEIIYKQSCWLDRSITVLKEINYRSDSSLIIPIT